MFRYPLSCNLINVFSCFLWKGTNNSWEQVFIIECVEFWEIYFLVDWKFLAISFLNFSISCHFCLLWPRTPNKQSDGCKALEHISIIPVFPEEDKIPDVKLTCFSTMKNLAFSWIETSSISMILGLLCFQMEISVISFNCSKNCFSCWCGFSFLTHSEAWARGIILAKGCGKK